MITTKNPLDPEVVRFHLPTLERWPSALGLAPGFFYLLACADWRDREAETRALASQALRQGLGGVSLWGPDACAAELWFDLEIIEFYEQRINEPADRFTVPTAHHEHETLDDAVFFAFHCGPTLEPPYISTIVALSVAHAEVAGVLDIELQDPNHSRRGSPRVRDIAAWSQPL